MAQASAEKLEHTGPAEKERVASELQREQLASTPEPPWPKGKETEHQIVRGKRVKVSERRTLARKRGIRAKAWRGKGGLHGEKRQAPKRKRRASEQSLPRGGRKEA